MSWLYGLIGLWIGGIAGVLVMAMVIAGSRADERQEKITQDPDSETLYTWNNPDIFQDPDSETLYTREDNLLTVRILKFLPDKRVRLEVVLSMLAHFKPDDTFALRYDDFKKRYNKRIEGEV
ncbi:MAG TPA: hypothetical protein VMW20_04255 [Candidatus Nanoarchaeia archaeon]|nr:hypothetical protein [Candidatus Nanoarchaeia archaeon]